ncbi:hypothetical protein PVAND_004592 [Polypedilum vanderplanki]|uniref:Cyclic nucleotide-binding domain-containing protein n=1 Tax=Polypedilum vanderplanki TaxID=319348 RepID=A0A9J6BZK2_POLVA|nr:hypothetical protein PVAND_004592 [Polypedilum vanderplanki]
MKYFEKFGHFCSLKYDEKLENYLDNLTWFQYLITIDPSSPITTSFFNSHSAVVNGMKYHLKNYPNTIHPFSKLKFIIECIMSVIFLCGLIYTPLLYMYYIRKDDQDTFGNVPVIYTIKLACALDMILRFFTGRVDERNVEIILDKKGITRKYLCGLFIFDFMTNFPFFIGLLMNLNPHDPEFHIVKLTTLFRIVRLPSLLRYIQRLMMRFKIEDIYVQILKLLLCWLCLIHWAACLHMAPGIIMSKFHVGVRVNAWYENPIFQEKDSFSKYVICLFKGVKTILGTGYIKELQPIMYFDKIYSSVLAIVGRICLFVTLAYMYQLLRSCKSAELRYDEMMVQLNKYTSCNRLPKSTQVKLKNNYDYIFCKQFFNEREILETVSTQLRQEIMIHNTRQLVENSQFFENLPSSLIIRIISVLTIELYFENDVIYNVGDIGSSIFFITSGSVGFYSPSNKEVCHYNDGDYFGEMSFISDVDYRFCKAIALETTECYKLSREDFQHLVNSYPDLLQKVEALALERMENIFMLEEFSNTKSDDGYMSINQRRFFMQN